MAAALWSCQGEGTSFPGEGTPVPLTFTGAFCWEASQAQVSVGTILTWDSTRPDPTASWREVTGEESVMKYQEMQKIIQIRLCTEGTLLLLLLFMSKICGGK